MDYAAFDLTLRDDQRKLNVEHGLEDVGLLVLSDYVAFTALRNVLFVAHTFCNVKTLVLSNAFRCGTMTEANVDDAVAMFAWKMPHLERLALGERTAHVPPAHGHCRCSNRIFCRLHYHRNPLVIEHCRLEFPSIIDAEGESQRGEARPFGRLRALALRNMWSAFAPYETFCAAGASNKALLTTHATVSWLPESLSELRVVGSQHDACHNAFRRDVVRALFCLDSSVVAQQLSSNLTALAIGDVHNFGEREMALIARCCGRRLQMLELLRLPQLDDAALAALQAGCSPEEPMELRSLRLDRCAREGLTTAGLLHLVFNAAQDKHTAHAIKLSTESNDASPIRCRTSVLGERVLVAPKLRSLLVRECPAVSCTLLASALPFSFVCDEGAYNAEHAQLGDEAQSQAYRLGRED
jgi:hypothetical protein